MTHLFLPPQCWRVVESNRCYQSWSCTPEDDHGAVIELRATRSVGSTPGWGRITLYGSHIDGVRPRLWTHDVTPIRHGRNIPDAVALLRALKASNLDRPTVSSMIEVAKLWSAGVRAGQDGPVPFRGMTIFEAVALLRAAAPAGHIQ